MRIKSLSSSWVGVAIQLGGWVFLAAWYTFTTNNNTRMIEAIQKQNSHVRLSILETKMLGYGELGKKIDLLSIQLARYETMLKFQHQSNQSMFAE